MSIADLHFDYVTLSQVMRTAPAPTTPRDLAYASVVATPEPEGLEDRENVVTSSLWLNAFVHVGALVLTPRIVTMHRFGNCV